VCYTYEVHSKTTRQELYNLLTYTYTHIHTNIGITLNGLSKQPAPLALAVWQQENIMIEL